MRIPLVPARTLVATTRKMSSSTTPKDITIIGGGIIGCSTAYYLTRHPAYSPTTHRITLLEASASNAGGRTADSIADPAALVDEPAAASRKNPAHEGIAGGASGKAGGLLALWAFPQNIVPLSFRLHDELAQEHDGARRWGYRRCWASQVDCAARVPPGFSQSSKSEQGASTGAEEPPSKGQGLHEDHKKASTALRKLGAPADLDWVSAAALRAYDNMGTPDDTAQVHPELFTRSLAQLAEDAGARIVTGARVTDIVKTADGGAVTDVVYEKDGKEEKLPTTACVVAAGPWTARLLPQVPVTSSRAHSVVIKAAKPLSPYALFTAIKLPAGFPAPEQKGSGNATLKRPQSVEPEIYARPDGTAYACGPTDADAPLPRSNAEVAVDEARCRDIATQVAGISDRLGAHGGAEVVAKQACYLPQGGPYIGEVGGVKGLVVAAGHTCWGIQNAPGTGKLVSELVLDGKATSARLGSCDPARVL